MRGMIAIGHPQFFGAHKLLRFERERVKHIEREDLHMFHSTTLSPCQEMDASCQIMLYYLLNDPVYSSGYVFLAVSLVDTAFLQIMGRNQLRLMYLRSEKSIAALSDPFRSKSFVQRSEDRSASYCRGARSSVSHNWPVGFSENIKIGHTLLVEQ